MYKLLKYFGVIIFLSSLPVISFSQSTQIKILGADEFEFNDLGDIKVKTLTGNVKLQQDEVFLFCDKAILNEDINSLEAIGNVVIKQDTVEIHSDHLFYDGKNRKAVLTGNVKMTDSKMVLNTSALDYDLNTKVASYKTGGILTSDTTTLTSKIGYYYATSNDVYFKKDVKVVSSQYNLTADTLRFNTDSRTAFFLGPTNITTDSSDIFCEGGFYNTSEDIAQFNTKAILINLPQILMADSIWFDNNSGKGITKGNVNWKDTLQHLNILADRAWFDNSANDILSVGHTLFISEVGNDTLFMTADTLHSTKDSVTDKRNFSAFHKVKIFKSDMQALCDSLYYSDADSMFRLYQNPVLWMEGNQMKADTVRIHLSNREVSKFELIKSSFMVSQVDTGLFNQVKGKNMTGFFEDGKLHHLLIEGNGENIYYAQDDSSAFIGVNKIICSSMIIYTDSSKVNRIKFISKPDGTMYPINQAPQDELKLKDFIWMDNVRPKSKWALFED